ncbi:MAG: polysaccharide deacetylase family protein [Fimbriiglobus sp.]|nr:polysaccharide deacetylase family protein [Fimbriiglobus sp.]
MGAIGPNAGQFVARPHRLKSIAGWRRQTGGVVQLTFDDGPFPIITNQVLSLLARYRTTGTFFVLGQQVRRHPECVKQILSAHHTVGNHTQTHPNFNWAAFNAPFRELLRNQAVVTAATGHRPTLTRPPFGRVTPGFLLAAWRLGLKIAGWTLDSGDWRCRNERDADVCASELVSEVRAGDVVLFHDTNPYLPRILAKVLPELDDRGWLKRNGQPTSCSTANLAKVTGREPSRTVDCDVIPAVSG